MELEPKKETETETDSTSPRRRPKRSKSSTTSADDITSQQPISNSKASTSAAIVDSNSEPLPIGEYDVFLNFRGPDTRHYITDIIYRFLARSKIRTFRDDDELRKGEGNLVKAIGQSKISIPIFSPRYAESKWCLKELAEIIEHCKREKGHIILSIFYEVDPGDVRSQTGPYQSAFQQHERNKIDEETIQSWKAALNEVGSLKGWHIKVKEEVADVADVVSGVVWSHLNKNNNTLETDELVGIDDHVEQVVDMLDLGCECVNLIGIHGMGGIGKTTLATAVYNKVSACFDRYSFVEDIREAQKQTDGVLVLQKKLLSNILRIDLVGSVIESKNIIRERVTQFKILVVLDDVDEKFQFEEVLGNLKSFAAGSRFIITSRDIKVLKRLSECQSKLYEVQGMNPSRSLQLFCKHAFRKEFPLSGFEVLSKNIVSTTGGLPLTLKVIGSFLYREEEVVWKGKLEQLRQMPEKGVMDRLMISYDALNYEAQQIFLDIACFHIGENKEIASYMWCDCKYHPVINVNILVQRSMLKIGEKSEFHMHDQLRDMGREIVRKENIEYPWMRSRIWAKNEAFELLVNKKGTKHVKAITLDSSRSYNDFETRSLKRECFKDLSELRYVDAPGIISLVGDFRHLLPNLKWFKSSNHLMARFNMKEIIVVNVKSLGDDCIQIKEAKKLKFLKLNKCSMMVKLPEFPKNLEMLQLKSFSNEEEDMEVGNLHNLKVLKLQSFTLGRINGGTVGMMERLQELNLNHIKCDFNNFRRVIADIGELSSLQSFKFKSPEMVDVLEGIKLPKSLKVLSTTSCFDNLSELLELEEFTIRNSLSEIDCENERTTTLVIWPAAKWKSMTLYSRTRIVMVQGHNTMLPSSLTFVDIAFIQSDRIPNLNNLSNLTELKLWYSPYLQEIRGIGGLKSLQILEIVNMGKLVHIEGLGNLMSSSNCKLTEVEIAECPLLRAFQTFEQHDHVAADTDYDAVLRTESLLSLKIKECPLLDCRSIQLSKIPRLRKLSIEEIGLNINDEADSKQDQLLEGFHNLGEMVELQVSRLPQLERFPSLSKLSNLTKFAVNDLPCLREIVGLGDLLALEWLQVSGCISLERLPSLSKLSKLWKLKVIDLPCLREIAGLGDLESLAYLTVSGCISLERLPSLSKLSKLWKLKVSDLPCLREIVGLGDLKSLHSLYVKGCISLERLPVDGLPNSSMNYIELDLRGCTNFTNVDSDLSPLTTQGADLSEVDLIIKWPHEPFIEESESSDDDMTDVD